MFMSMFNDFEGGSKTMSKHVLQTQQRSPNTRSNSSLVIGVSVDQDKTNFGVARAWTNQTEDVGLHCQENDTEVGRSFASTLLLC